MCLGIAISLSEDKIGLQTAYGNFATEVRLMKPNFKPKSVVIAGEQPHAIRGRPNFPYDTTFVLLTWCTKSQQLH